MKDQAKSKRRPNAPEGKINEAENLEAHYDTFVQVLRESEKKYRELVENANSIIIKMDREGKITFFNEYAQQFFGYSPDEILGRDVKILVPPVESNRRNLITMVDEILRNPDGFVENINENVLKNGTRVWISWRNKAILDSSGNVVETLSVGQDITQLKQSEDSLRSSELRFRSLFESNVDGMMITVTDGSILSANARMCEMLSMTEEEIVDAGREGIVVKDEKLSVALEERARTGKFYGELTFRRKDGSLMPTEFSSILFKDFDGTIKTSQVVRDITERKQAELALKRAYSELEQRVEQRTADIKRQAELLDLAYDAVIVREEDGRITYWNTGAQETYGWTKEEALDKVAHDLLHTQFPVPLPDIMTQMKQKGRWEGELIHTLKDGSPIIVLSRWALRQDEQNYRQEIMEVNSDISIRKASELAMRKAGAYNRSLIEASIDPLVTIGPDGRITDVNTATEEATGYHREELIGTDFSHYFTDLKKAKAGYKLVFKEGFIRDYELAIRHRDGHITPIFYNASVYRDEMGQVAGVFAAARDISERKRAEEMLRLHGQILSNMVEGVNLIRIDDMTIVYANPRLEVMFDYDQGELIGKHVSILNAPSEKDSLEVVKEIRASISKAGYWQGEVRNITKSGREFWCHGKVSRINHSQYGDAYISVQSDITERKRTEEELLDKSKALEELNTALKVLIDHYKSDQRELEERIISNITLRIVPYLEKLKYTRLDVGQSALLEIIERNLRDISSPFLKMISSEQLRLTPNEIEIITLIKAGKTTKDIAHILGKGIRTVDSFRDNIRVKLGIAQKKVNLRTYLLSLHNT